MSEMNECKSHNGCACVEFMFRIWLCCYRSLTR